MNTSCFRKNSYYPLLWLVLPFFTYLPASGAALITPEARSQNSPLSVTTSPGTLIAREITQRYKDITSECSGGNADYYCRGVLLRVTDAAENYHSWNPSKASVKRNGVSFYYLNKEGGIKTLGLTSVGLIFSALQDASAYELVARCSYPSNGYSDTRTDSCNARRGYPKSRPCDEQGIDTVAAWVAHYSKSGSGKYQCGFKTDKASFSLSQTVRHHFPNPADKEKGNEIVIAAWPQDIPAKLPLDAIFYQQLDDIPKAQIIQRDYNEQTGKVLPILHVDLNASDDEKFLYEPAVQAIKNTVP